MWIFDRWGRLGHGVFIPELNVRSVARYASGLDGVEVAREGTTFRQPTDDVLFAEYLRQFSQADDFTVGQTTATHSWVTRLASSPRRTEIEQKTTLPALFHDAGLDEFLPANRVVNYQEVVVILRNADPEALPLVIQHGLGGSGKGTWIIRDPSALAQAQEEIALLGPATRFRVSEYIDGHVTNVNCLTYRDGNRVVTLPGLFSVKGAGFERFGFRPGQSAGNSWGAMLPFREHLPELEHIAVSLGQHLATRYELCGVWGFDAVVGEGNVRCLEVNPRFQGTSASDAHLRVYSGLPSFTEGHIRANLGLSMARFRPESHREFLYDFSSGGDHGSFYVKLKNWTGKSIEKPVTNLHIIGPESKVFAPGQEIGMLIGESADVFFGRPGELSHPEALRLLATLSPLPDH